MARITRLKRLTKIALASASGGVLLLAALTPAEAAHPHDWYTKWDCGSSRGAYFRVVIYDPGEPDGASIYMTSNQDGEQWNRPGAVDEEFHIAGSHGDAYIILGGTYNDPDAPSIDVGRTGVTCRP